jgi:catechol 2,3-dioxygenase-like lactoylglutathione lyase family enzyme
MAVDGIRHVSLPVTDLTTSIEFYETVIEADPVGPDDPDASVADADAYWFRVGGGQYLVLAQRRDRDPNTGERSPEVALGVDESTLVGLRARLNAMDHDYRESSTALRFTDPDGNRLKVTTAPGPA